MNMQPRKAREIRIHSPRRLAVFTSKW